MLGAASGKKHLFIVQRCLCTNCKDSTVRSRNTCHKVTVFYLKMGLSPWFWDLLVWNGCPRRLTVPLLFEFATEGLFYVVHVEGTDR